MTITNTGPDEWAELRADLHTFMWRKKVTQTAAAQALGVSQSTFGKKMRGEVVMTTAELLALAKFAGLTITIAPEGVFVIDNDGDYIDKRARRDSNPQPSDLYPARLRLVWSVKRRLTADGRAAQRTARHLGAVS